MDAVKDTAHTGNHLPLQHHLPLRHDANCITQWNAAGHRASDLHHIVSGRPIAIQIFPGCPSPANYYDLCLLVQRILRHTTSYTTDHNPAGESQ